MFRTLKKIVKGTVVITGEAVKIGTKVASTVTTEAVAIPTELFMGKNALSDGLRKVNKGVKKVTDVAIDRVAKPLVIRGATAPFTKAEHLKEVARGAYEATFTENRVQGLKRIGKATPYVVMMGLVDEEDVETVFGFLGIGADAVGGAGEAAADMMTATVAETVADAGVADAAEELASVGTAAAPALAAASTDAPHAVATHVSHAIRFSGENPVGDIRNLITAGNTDLLQEAVQDMIERLSPNAPDYIEHQLRLVQNGDLDMVETALQNAKPYLKGRAVKAFVHFE
ncbi:MAG TPA: hypothetical protein VEQ60_10940 [Longimicrobium sp.]|nr:hypothetical protein [Longimicrobium sp.]